MPKRKLKIAIFHLAFFYSGGGEKLVLEEISHLAKRGHRVDCYTPVIDHGLCFPDVINSYNIKTIFPFLEKILPHQESLQIMATCLLFPFAAGRFRGYDIIIGANQPGPWLAWIIKKLYNVPYLIYLAQPTRILYPRAVDKKTGMWVKDKKTLLPLLVRVFRPLFFWADKKSIAAADAFLANGTYIGRILQKTYARDNIIFCPAGANYPARVEKNRWRGVVRANGHRVQKPYLLITNRHFPQKRFEYAIRAMPQILRKFPNITLVITGNPTYYTEKLNKIVSDLRLQSRVLFTGYIAEQDLSRLYSGAALYLYTSPEEDFGMGIIEAMAHAVPVVAWDKAGPSTTVISGKTGILVKPYSRERFTRAITTLISDRTKNKSFGSHARRIFLKNYTFTKHVDILERSLQDIASKA